MIKIVSFLKIKYTMNITKDFKYDLTEYLWLILHAFLF